MHSFQKRDNPAQAQAQAGLSLDFAKE
jgi:hypothetical protein